LHLHSHIDPVPARACLHTRLQAILCLEVLAALRHARRGLLGIAPLKVLVLLRVVDEPLLLQLRLLPALAPAATADHDDENDDERDSANNDARNPRLHCHNIRTNRTGSTTPKH